MHKTDTSPERGASPAATPPWIKGPGLASGRNEKTALKRRPAVRERGEAARERAEIQRDLRAAGLRYEKAQRCSS